MNPARITPCSQTLIDNIFYNEVQRKIIAGNIATDISQGVNQKIIIGVERTQIGKVSVASMHALAWPNRAGGERGGML